MTAPNDRQPDQAPAQTGAQALLDLLEDWQTEYVITCPGSTEAAFLDTSAFHPSIRVLTVLHESIAVSMADGYSRATGRPGVIYLHANVGMANAIAHLSAAQLASSPVVILNGLKATAIQGRGGFTTVPAIRDYIRQHVKWDWQVLESTELAGDVARALTLSSATPCGPTWVGLPQNLLEAETAQPEVPRAARRDLGRGARPSAHEVEQACRLLRDAKRPALIIGSEVARRDAVPESIRLAETLGAPAFAEDRRTLERLPFPTTHPSYAGSFDPSRAAPAQADVVFLVGARSLVDFEPRREPAIGPGTKVIHLHSDPREVGRYYAADAALVGDAKLTLQDLLAALDASPRPVGADREFLAACRNEYVESRAAVVGDPAAESHPIKVRDLVAAIADSVDDDTVVVSDCTTSESALQHALQPTRPDQFHRSSSGSLGWGVGAALGIQLGQPDRSTMCVLGDGVFYFGMAGLAAAVTYNLPVTFVVINNKSYAAVGAALRRYDGPGRKTGPLPGVDISGPGIAQIAAGFGLMSVRVDDPADVAAALKAARAHQGPSLVEIMTDPVELGP